MKYYEIELNGETVKFRLTSNDCMTIEKSSGKSIIEYIQDMSMETIITLLRYMRRSSQHDFSQEDASNLFDKLVDADYTIEKIVTDIILEALAVSGFMSKGDLTKMKEVKKQSK